MRHQIHHPLKKAAILMLFILWGGWGICSPRSAYNAMGNNVESLGDVRLYGGLIHQHQNFFLTPFSFTGVEAGVLLDRKIIVGAFGASFLSSLSVEISNVKTALSLTQGGLVFGAVHHFTGFLEAGLLLQTGILSVKGEPKVISKEGSNSGSFHIQGATVMPQMITGLCVAKYLKIRIGLGYSLYNFEGNSGISTKDLQNISLNFGFLFGIGK